MKYRDKHIVCFYTGDFSNESEVRQVAKKISDILGDVNLFYKTDVFTDLGIYPNDMSGIMEYRYIYTRDGMKSVTAGMDRSLFVL